MVTFAARAVLAISLPLGLAACGTATTSASSDDLEATTVPGLAAAVMTHLERDAVVYLGGTGNEHEKWQAVQMRVKVGPRTVPLDVMVSELPEKQREPVRAAHVCRDGAYGVLTCTAKTRDDGSVVARMASREDPVGGWFGTGFMAYVIHHRDDQVVMVMESLDSRARHLVELERLPVDVAVLEEIATDPLVGVRTSRELNHAGEEIPGMSVG